MEDFDGRRDPTTSVTSDEERDKLVSKVVVVPRAWLPFSVQLLLLLLLLLPFPFPAATAGAAA